ncbi:MAG TPA: AbrB/MazE/SpoVT family DNA-binding domain-containing protein [Anaerolineae bacterium]|nr:AbrB/MazE/SpoVT family DNA-binding domain-containing protein [Anaerolineae bacterium]
METTTVSSRGQVVIPKSIRKDYEWGAGVVLELERHEGGIFLREKNPFPPTTLDDIVGFLQHDGPAITIEEMDKAIKQAVLEKWHDRN